MDSRSFRGWRGRRRDKRRRRRKRYAILFLCFFLLLLYTNNVYILDSITSYDNPPPTTLPFSLSKWDMRGLWLDNSWNPDCSGDDEADTDTDTDAEGTPFFFCVFFLLLYTNNVYILDSITSYDNPPTTLPFSLSKRDVRAVVWHRGTGGSIQRWRRTASLPDRGVTLYFINYFTYH